jgi:uncharacterized membrane protein
VLACAAAVGMRGGAFWPVGIGLTIVFWALLAWVGFRLFRSWRPSVAWAESTLSRRFAAGEIDADEYRARLEVLRGERAT